MRVMYLDCFAGIAGDMFLGALIDAGADVDYIVKGLSSLNLCGYEFTAVKSISHGIAATSVNINVTEEQPHRHLEDIIQIINSGDYSDNTKTIARKVFKLIAQAEARVHGTTEDHIHFHEVGAIDSICDIIGTLLAIENLKIDQVYCSPLPLGSGFVHCAHGRIPVPAPATLEIIKGVPVRKSDIEGELVTPTGAALAVTISRRFTTIPSMVIDSTGYGMGTKDHGIPNVLRVIIGRAIEGDEQDYSLDVGNHDDECVKCDNLGHGHLHI